MQKDLTRIAFRKEKESGEIVAIFYDSNDKKSAYNDKYECYAHIGQHGDCSRAWIKEDTTPASVPEYLDLMKELNAIGYHVKPMKRTRF